MSETIWTRKASEHLKNLLFYRNAIRVMRELSEDDEQIPTENGETLADRLRRTERLVACIEEALRMLTDTERFFLDRMLIHSGEFLVDDIQEEVHMEKSNVYRLRKQALEKFTLAMYGRL